MVSSRHPFQRLSFCCTAVVPEVRDAVTDAIRTLGGEHTRDLIRTTTHLVTGNTHTAKYVFIARHRPDIRLVLPEFVTAAKEVWLRGEDESEDEIRAWISQLEEKYRPPVFWGVRACVTGFASDVVRQKLKDTIRKHGGELEFCLAPQTTHLIAEYARGKKYDFARKWKVKVVALDWVNASLERTMMLDEACFDILLPREQMGKGAIESTDEPATTGKRKRADEPGVESGPAKETRRLRPTASIRLGDNPESIWKHIATGPAKPMAAAGDWDITETARPSRRADDEAVPAQKSVEADPADSSGRSIFGRLVFLLAGFTAEQGRVMRSYVESHGGIVYVSTELAGRPDRCDSLKTELAKSGREAVLVRPHDQPMPSYPALSAADLGLNSQLDSVISRMRIGTQWWVERCLHSRRLVALPAPATRPDQLGSQMLLVPFRSVGATAVAGWQGLRVSSTGFEDMELRHFNLLVSLMGATLHEGLRTDTDVLVCAPKYCSQVGPGRWRLVDRSMKIDFAVENRVPVVAAEWAWQSIAAGKKASMAAYEVAKTGRVSTPTTSDLRADFLKHVPHSVAASSAREVDSDLRASASRSVSAIEAKSEPKRKMARTLPPQSVSRLADRLDQSLVQVQRKVDSGRDESAVPRSRNPFADAGEGPEDEVEADAGDPVQVEATILDLNSASNDQVGPEDEPPSRMVFIDTTWSSLARPTSNRRGRLGRNGSGITPSNSSTAVDESSSATTPTLPGPGLNQAPSITTSVTGNAGGGNKSRRQKSLVKAISHVTSSTACSTLTPTGSVAEGDNLLDESQFFPSQGLGYDDDPVQRRRREALMLKVERQGGVA